MDSNLTRELYPNPTDRSLQRGGQARNSGTLIGLTIGLTVSLTVGLLLLLLWAVPSGASDTPESLSENHKSAASRRIAKSTKAAPFLAAKDAPGARFAPQPSQGSVSLSPRHRR